MDNPELIGWISLGVAVLAIAVTVFFYILQEKKANKKLKIEAETAARKFIQDNSDERDFIQWATIAAYNVPYKVDTTRERDCLKC